MESKLKTKQTSRSATPLLQKLKYKKWTAIGSIILFLSWVSQSYFQEKWHSEVERIERNKLAIAFNEVNKNLYQIFLNEEQSRSLADTNYDHSLLLAFHAYDLYANMLYHLGTTLTSDRSDYLNENDETFRGNVKDINEWAKNEEIDKLQWFAKRLSRWETENGMNVIGTYQTRLAEIRHKEEFWNNVYLLLYVLGASILGYAFLLDYRMTKIEK